MIKKRNSFSLKLVGLETLARRLHGEDEHRPRILEQVRIARAGVNGEKILAGVFDKYTFRAPHFVFHDLNLRSTGAFQIDTLFLSVQGVTILEVKNIAGRIYFPPEQNQMMRTLENGQVDVYECPSVQLARNKLLLEDWFHANGLDIPIRTAVVFSNSRQQFDNFRAGLKILFPLEVPVYLREVLETPQFLDIPTMKMVANKLHAAHRDYDPFPLCEKYKFMPNLIKTGVLCQQCGLHGMISIRRGWICPSCRYFSKDAHREAIIEYFMLFGGMMTNKACKAFLHVPNGDKTMRLIKQMGLPYNGEKKGRTYYFPLEDLRKALIALRGE